MLQIYDIREVAKWCSYGIDPLEQISMKLKKGLKISSAKCILMWLQCTSQSTRTVRYRIRRSIFSQIFKKTPHSSPVGARYGVSIVDPASAWNSVPAPVIIYVFLHDQSWISTWIKSMSNELDITIHVIASQLSRSCDITNNRLWLHQWSKDGSSETGGRCVEIVVSSSFMYSLCRVRKTMMCVFSWRAVSVLTRVLFWCLFPWLLRNSGNNHLDNPLVGAVTDRVHILFSIYLTLMDRVMTALDSIYDINTLRTTSDVWMVQ